MSCEQHESDPKTATQEIAIEGQVNEAPYSDHPVVLRGEEATIILGEN